MTSRKAMVCSSCGNTFESEVVHLALIPIQVCPSCGPIADIFTMAGTIEKLQADKVWVSLTSQEPKLLAKALKDVHPDFQDTKIAEVLKHVRESAIDGTVSFEMPRHLAGLVCALVAAKHAGVSAQAGGA
jgi:hypothetical protein